MFFHLGYLGALFFSGHLSNFSEGSSSIPFAGSFSLASLKCWCCPKSSLLGHFSPLPPTGLRWDNPFCFVYLPICWGPQGDITAILGVQVWYLTPWEAPMCGTSISLFVVDIMDWHSVFILTLFRHAFQYSRGWGPYAVFPWVWLMFHSLEEFAQSLEGGREGGQFAFVSDVTGGLEATLSKFCFCFDFFFPVIVLQLLTSWVSKAILGVVTSQNL